MEQDVYDSYIKAGKIAAQALEFGASLIKPDNKVVDVCNQVEKKIIELGGEIAFPVQISMNDVAAHYCPTSDDETVFKDQLCNLDIGVHINGYIADTATTVDLSGKHQDLVKASREALNNALEIIKPGITLGEIGKVIHDTITKYGFSPVKNLCGHGLSHFNIHDKPQIPNYDTNDKTELKQDMVIAIEPFASTGAGKIYESGHPTVYQLKTLKPVRMQMVRNILKHVVKYGELPFTTRCSQKSLGKQKHALH